MTDDAAAATGPDDSDAALKRLIALHPKRIDLSLDRLRTLLGRLGDPQRRAPPVVHIAGTNGKGSTAAFVRAGLEADGRRTHVYTSPHLVRFHERIRLAGELIDKARLLSLLQRCEQVNGGDPITFFEITTAAAFLAFAEAPADVLVLEVGLGGRLDATNVIDTPALTMITPVSMDHAEFLGDTVAAIAAEKAGILKPGVPCVVSAQPPEALAAIAARAAEVGAPLRISGRDWVARSDGDGLRVNGPDGRSDLPAPALAGAHQVENAGAAAVALRLLGCSNDAISRAMTDVDWPARLQRLSTGRFADLAGPTIEIWLDGGHNAAAGAALARAAAAWRAADDRAPALVVGMLSSKDASAFLAPFAGVAGSVRTVSIPGEPAARPAEDLAADAKALGLDAAPATSVETAVAALCADPTPPRRILICGSLYLAGHVLAG